MKRTLTIIQDVQTTILLWVVYWIFVSIASVLYRARIVRLQAGWEPWKSTQDTLEDITQQF